MRRLTRMTKLRKVCFFVAFICISFTDASAIPTRIFGDVSTYINKKISVYHYPHHLFDEPDLLATQRIDEGGRLDVSFDIKETTRIYLDLESYHVYFLISPGDTFHVELPLFKATSNADKYNIFYQPQQFYLSPLSGDNRALNISATRFEMMLDERFRSAINASRSINGDSIIQAHILALRKIVEQEKDPFLKQYKHFKIAPFYSLAYPLDPSVQIDSFFVNASPEINNPSFWDALNSALKNRDALGDKDDVYLSKTHEWIKEKNGRKYATFLKQHYGIKNDALADLIMLLDIQYLWHGNAQIRDDILAFLKVLHLESKSQMITDLADRLYSHLSRVYPGMPARYFELPDRKGKLVPLQLKRKVVVLNFCSPELQQCARDFITLEKMKKELGRKVEIINVVVYQDKPRFVSYANSYKGKAHFVHWNNNDELLKAYQVKSLPAFYIIGPHGKFISSPAPGPDEGLSQTLETILRLF